MTNNPLDPEFWEALGITPIVVDPEDAESVTNVFEQITQIITEVVNESSNKSSEDNNG